MTDKEEVLLDDVIDAIHTYTYTHFLNGRANFSEFCIVRTVLWMIKESMEKGDKNVK